MNLKIVFGQYQFEFNCNLLYSLFVVLEAMWSTIGKPRAMCSTNLPGIYLLILVSTTFVAYVM